MKINNVIRLAYVDREPLYRRLANDVKDRLKSAVEDRRWFFIYRVKSLESFAMKIETGRVIDPENLDDFFACTIVVPTIAELSDAEDLICQNFDKIDRKPPVPTETHKRPSNFEFDDLRLYVRRKTAMTGASEDLDELIFEVQVKTVLQYAWSVATHDLIYKTDSVSWTKERIAFQVKAMLEHAELAISEATNLSTASGFEKADDYTKEISSVIGVIESVWEEDFLPIDMKRLAENVLPLLRAVGIDSSGLKEVLDKEIVRNQIIPSDLSPYAFIVQALANNKELDLKNKLKSKRKLRILVHDGMDLPDWCKDHSQCISIGRKK